MIRESTEWGEDNGSMLTIKCKELPITISWDATKVSSFPHEMKLINWMPGSWGLESCTEGSGEYDMSEISSLQIDATDFKIKDGDKDLLTLFLSYIPTTVSTNNHIEVNNLARLYPNPAQSTLSIKANKNSSDLFVNGSTIKLYDALGKIVLEQEVSPEIQLGILDNGIYFYIIELPNYTAQKGKIMVLK